MHREIWMPFQSNQVIGTYVLDRLLGRGAFGEVWLAHHHDLDKVVALKIPTDPKYLQQLRREGKIIYGLEHPNIVRGYDLNTLNDPPYVAMEYVEGVALRQKIKTIGKLPEAEAMRIIRQILAALAFAHGQGVLHRDLKPENVLLTAAGVAKVTDFGLGKVQAEVAHSIIFSGSVVSGDGRSVSGTVQYMSPQQQAGESPDVRDDIYAVGIIACELLTGSRPTPAGIVKMLLRAKVHAVVAPMLEKALEQDRSCRYASALEMLRAVDGLPSALAELKRARATQEGRHRAEEEHRRQEIAEPVCGESVENTTAEVETSDYLVQIARAAEERRQQEAAQMGQYDSQRLVWAGIAGIGAGLVILVIAVFISTQLFGIYPDSYSLTALASSYFLIPGISSIVIGNLSTKLVVRIAKTHNKSMCVIIGIAQGLVLAGLAWMVVGFQYPEQAGHMVTDLRVVFAASVAILIPLASGNGLLRKLRL